MKVSDYTKTKCAHGHKAARNKTALKYIRHSCTMQQKTIVEYYYTGTRMMPHTNTADTATATNVKCVPMGYVNDMIRDSVPVTINQSNP